MTALPIEFAAIADALPLVASHCNTTAAPTIDVLIDQDGDQERTEVRIYVNGTLVHTAADIHEETPTVRFTLLDSGPSDDYRTHQWYEQTIQAASRRSAAVLHQIAEKARDYHGPANDCPYCDPEPTHEAPATTVAENIFDTALAPLVPEEPVAELGMAVVLDALTDPVLGGADAYMQMTQRLGAIGFDLTEPVLLTDLDEAPVASAQWTTATSLSTVYHQFKTTTQALCTAPLWGLEVSHPRPLLETGQLPTFARICQNCTDPNRTDPQQPTELDT